jgi:hypothetical protein
MKCKSGTTPAAEIIAEAEAKIEYDECEQAQTD